MSKHKKIVIMQTVQEPSANASVQEKMRAVVSNTGNILFQNAVLNQIKWDAVAKSWSEIDQNVGTVVMTLANFIRPGVDMGADLSAIEKSKIEKIVLIGVGAQAYGYDEVPEIDKNTLKFLKVVSERSSVIGVRGYYTAELLSGIGIKNVEVMGCPSIFLGMRPDFRVPEPLTPFDARRMAVHATPSGFFRDRVAALFGFAARHEADYVLQSESYLASLILDEGLASEDDRKRSVYLSRYYNDGSVSAETLFSWLMGHSRIFFNLPDWTNYVKTRSLLIGTRFHGNVIGILSGIKTLTMVFDTRTREMCEYLELPHINCESFDPGLDPKHYYELANYSEFNAGFARKYANYYGFLERNGLPNNLPRPIGGGRQSIEGTADAIDGFGALNVRDRVRMKSLLNFLTTVMGDNMSPRVASGVLDRLCLERSEVDRALSEKTPPATFQLPKARL